jgi:hypothetical protein
MRPPNKKSANAPESVAGGSYQGIVQRQAWKIMVKHPMWKGWKSQVKMYGCSRDQAWEEARKAFHYYEGATATKVMPLNAEVSNATGRMERKP